LSQNKTIVLPNNDQKARLENLNQHVDTWLRDDLDSFSNIKSNHQQTESIEISNLNCEIELWTSGSTGTPKAITKQFRQLLEEARTLHQHFPMMSTKVYSTIPHFHIYGLLFKILWPTLTYRCFNRETSFTLEDFQAKSKQQDNYLLVSCPAHLKRLPDALAQQSIEVQFEKIFSSGGACEPNTCQWWSEHLQSITEVFGSTETGGVAYRENGHLTRSWTCLPQVNIKSDHQVLSVHSPFTGTDEWMSMGDLVEISDNQQSFILKGRSDRIIKVQEKRVSLIEMEHHLKDHPDVTDSFIFMPDASYSNNNKLSAVITLNQQALPNYYRKGHRAFIQALCQYLTSWFEPMTLPKSWRVCSEIPYNTSGKRTSEACQYLWKDSFSRTQTLPYLLDISTKGLNETSLLIECPYHLNYFKGHFPEHPILAGVVQLHWAKILCTEVFKIDLPVREILRLKFKSVLCPGDRVSLNLKYLPEKSSLTFQFQNDSEVFSSGTLKFQSAEINL
jgi:acyl-coenzyme A synthetase/AMP-(fatty) acid ligase/3-hydroxymyristoyl/3-hydroxydecanoyl-(acyl carrier protein) dehydratase